jgi:D-sedoheptulose 7-phosphate isomerase
MSTEFVCRFMTDRRPFPAICLNAHGGDLTAIGNDYAFTQVFQRQVYAFGKPGDVLLAITTTGNSENIRLAIAAANDIGMTSIALLGRDGGACRGLATVELLVPGDVTARIQEAQKLLIHTICESVEPRLADAT